MHIKKNKEICNLNTLQIAKSENTIYNRMEFRQCLE